jgi:hypothetical protein
MIKKKYKLIYIEWHDAHCGSGWYSFDEAKHFNSELCIVKECGFLIHESKKEIVLAMRYSDYRTKAQKDNPQWGMIQKIPKTWIQKRKTIGSYEL